MGAAHKLRIVNDDIGHIPEPSVTEWTIFDRGLRAVFWSKDTWDALPPSARPKNAQRQGNDGYLALLPA